MYTRYKFVVEDGTVVESSSVIANPKFVVGDTVDVRYLKDDYYTNVIDSIWFYGFFKFFHIGVGLLFLICGLGYYLLFLNRKPCK